jgi:hypothetical protein
MWRRSLPAGTAALAGAARVSHQAAYGRFARYVGEGAAVLVIGAFITFAIVPMLLPLIVGR